ncbi:hypothetical protein HK102_003099 [Quaeritorhiza haematococci]|nr:hypothetical protein HK102_003099 [Quaeritorhiza haematococci]
MVVIAGYGTSEGVDEVEREQQGVICSRSVVGVSVDELRDVLSSNFGETYPESQDTVVEKADAPKSPQNGRYEHPHPHRVLRPALGSETDKANLQPNGAVVEKTDTLESSHKASGHLRYEQPAPHRELRVDLSFEAPETKSQPVDAAAAELAAPKSSLMGSGQPCGEHSDPRSDPCTVERERPTIGTFATDVELSLSTALQNQFISTVEEKYFPRAKYLVKRWLQESTTNEGVRLQNVPKRVWKQFLHMVLERKRVPRGISSSSEDLTAGSEGSDRSKKRERLVSFATQVLLAVQTSHAAQSKTIDAPVWTDADILDLVAHPDFDAGHTVPLLTHLPRLGVQLSTDLFAQCAQACARSSNPPGRTEELFEWLDRQGYDNEVVMSLKKDVRVKKALVWANLSAKRLDKGLMILGELVRAMRRDGLQSTNNAVTTSASSSTTPLPSTTENPSFPDDETLHRIYQDMDIEIYTLLVKAFGMQGKTMCVEWIVRYVLNRKWGIVEGHSGTPTDQAQAQQTIAMLDFLHESILCFARAGHVDKVEDTCEFMLSPPGSNPSPQEHQKDGRPQQNKSAVIVPDERIFRTVIELLDRSYSHYTPMERFYKRMVRDHGVRPSSFVYAAMIRGALRRGLTSKAEWYVSRYRRTDVDMDEQNTRRAAKTADKSQQRPRPMHWMVYTVLIDGYMKLGLKEKAMDLFDEARWVDPKLSIKVYGSVINGLVAHGDLESAFTVFEDVITRVCDNDTGRAGQTERVKPVIPDSVIFTTVATGVARQGDVVVLEGLLDMMRRRSIDVDPIYMSVLLSGYVRTGFMDKAFWVLEEMKLDPRSFVVPRLWYTLDAGDSGWQEQESEMVPLLKDLTARVQSQEQNDMDGAGEMAGYGEEADLGLHGSTPSVTHPHASTHQETSTSVTFDNPTLSKPPISVAYEKIIRELCFHKLPQQALVLLREACETGVGLGMEWGFRPVVYHYAKRGDLRSCMQLLGLAKRYAAVDGEGVVPDAETLGKVYSAYVVQSQQRKKRNRKARRGGEGEKGGDDHNLATNINTASTQFLEDLTSTLSPDADVDVDSHGHPRPLQRVRDIRSLAYASMITHHCVRNEPEYAENLFLAMQEEGLELDVATCGLMAEMYRRAGETDKAVALLTVMDVLDPDGGDGGRMGDGRTGNGPYELDEFVIGLRQVGMM